METEMQPRTSGAPAPMGITGGAMGGVPAAVAGAARGPEVPAHAVPHAAPAPVVAAAAPRGKSRRGLVLLLALGVAVAGGALAYLRVTAGHESTDDAQVTTDMVAVGVRVSGQITQVLVSENQIVKKGQPLVELDAADYRARVKQAEAELAIARAQAENADAQTQVVEATSRGSLLTAKASVAGSNVSVSSAEAQEASARAALLRSQTEARKAEQDLKRARDLVAASAMPQERLDAAQATYDTAQAALAQSQANVAVAHESKAVARTRVREAQGRLNQSAPIDAQISAARANAELAHARVRSAEAALELAQNQLSYTKIVAPKDGMAARLSARTGQLVSVGQPVVELIPVESYVLANFKETQVGQMRPGQDVEIEIDAFPGRKLAGKIESISGGTGASFALLPADNASGNFVKVVQRVPVRVAWASLPGDLVLRAGMSAEVTVHTASN